MTSSDRFQLFVMAARHAVCRFDSRQDLTAIWEYLASTCSPAVDSKIGDGQIVSLTTTPTEYSLVVAEAWLDGWLTQSRLQPQSIERNWRVIGIDGTLDFAMVGVLANLSSILADASVSIFCLSTFDTDYLMVQEDKLGIAIEALRLAGHHIGD